ncbi:hypothetical protein CF394_10375 [Tetzosporium hominis]|uniref:Family 2 glycosyl transferase n=1 Tax=Tetzosporium hominis TaxID=2020506 RepID=A0A264W1X7_9BACL|nr:hypothetical protein [Tetzosporium hominis]OZS77606.1 hypothetical protein CF394_10375 [Tetzosporium hominis]
MNRFVLLILLVAGIFGLPYLFWLFQGNSGVSASEQTREDLQQYQGMDWYFKHVKWEGDSAPLELSILPEDVTQEKWDAAIDAEQKQKLVLLQPINWLGVQDELLKREIEDFTGARSTGWVFRYFDDLSSSNSDIPESTLALQENWDYSGAGYIFTNDRLEQVVVVPSDEPLEQGTEEQWVTSDFQGWIEVMDASIDEEVSFWFRLPDEVTNQLEGIVDGQQVPGIIERSHPKVHTAYMAGNFQELESPPGLYQIYALSDVYGFFYKNRSDGFYWSTFTDELDRIIANAKELPGDVEKRNEELTYHSRIGQDEFEVKVDGEWQSFTAKGVNIGMGAPGYFPGEAGISEEQYYRWFQQIGEMNANSIRVYTVHPPGFYRALKRYNEEHDTPLYVFHGVWAEEELLEETKNAFNEETQKRFQKEYQDIVNILHGNARVLPQVGHASGTYDADISDYVIGWIIGIEWYPEMVIGTNEANKDIGDYEGEYVYTEGASPFEHWLAEHMDDIIKYEMDTYNEIRPISFTNWVTTDLLDHPSEPLENEDMVSVNPNVVSVKGELEKVGQFASYHIYPYYPDFLNVDKTYREYVDQDGMKNSYAGYLNDLKKAHKMPVLVAEFGIPASRGGTHVNPYGWNQGNVTEEQQGEIVAKLYRTILAEDYLGGLVFSWQDEWFKRTWNTMDYDNPERRPYWSNQQTNEQHFGLLSFDSMKVKVDGDFEDWAEEEAHTKKSSVELKVSHDETYLYLNLLGIKETDLAQILLDTIPDQGNKTVRDVKFQEGIDFQVSLDGDESRLLIDSYYDFYHYLYGNDQKMIEPVSTGRKNSGKFTPIYYVLNKQLYYPELKKVEPFQFYETGKLTRGNGNPSSPDYNSLADYEFGEEGVEIRIPWLLLQFRDPSRLEVIGDVFQDGVEASEVIESIGIGAIVETEDGEVVVLPGESQELPRYTWETWNIPTFQERLKPSYYILQDAFK